MSYALRIRSLPFTVLIITVLILVSTSLWAQPPNMRPPRFGADPNIGVPGAVPGANIPGAGFPAVSSAGSCSKCKKTVTWQGTPPSSCPHCGTKFGYVQNADGTKTLTKTGMASSIVGMLIGGVLLLALLIGGGIALSRMAARTAKKRKAARKKKRLASRYDDEDDYDDDDRPAKKRRVSDDEDDYDDRPSKRRRDDDDDYDDRPSKRKR